MTPPTEQNGRESGPLLRLLADFLGHVLLRELGAEELAFMRSAEVAGVLAELGVELPTLEEEAQWLEERGADYHDLFLRPEAGPLVQSLWTQGRYEGDATVRVRQLAEEAAVDFQPEAARGAAVDHLGSLLLLWSKTADRAPEIANEIAKSHLQWAQIPLKTIAAAGGFYGAIASSTASFIELPELNE